MIIYLVLIIIAALLQTTVTSINLTLLVMIIVAFLSRNSSPYTLSLFAGILLGLLSGVNIGFYSLVFLGVVLIVALYRQTPVSGNNFFLVPLVTICSAFTRTMQLMLMRQSIDFLGIIIDTAAFFIVYLLFHAIEDRFNTRSDLRLKIR